MAICDATLTAGFPTQPREKKLSLEVMYTMFIVDLLVEKSADN